jgi:hypothetical protein
MGICLLYTSRRVALPEALRKAWNGKYEPLVPQRRAT